MRDLKPRPPSAGASPPASCRNTTAGLDPGSTASWGRAWSGTGHMPIRSPPCRHKRWKTRRVPVPAELARAHPCPGSRAPPHRRGGGRDRKGARPPAGPAPYSFRPASPESGHRTSRTATRRAGHPAWTPERRQLYPYPGLPYTPQLFCFSVLSTNMVHLCRHLKASPKGEPGSRDRDPGAPHWLSAGRVIKLPP